QAVARGQHAGLDHRSHLGRRPIQPHAHRERRRHPGRDLGRWQARPLRGRLMTIFLAILGIVSGLATVEGLLQGLPPLTADYLLLIVFACVAAPMNLDLGHNARISTLQPLMLAAIALFGIREAILLSAISKAYFWAVGRPR